jgi:RNA polymerase sigma-70 factor (ECF subfamily)
MSTATLAAASHGAAWSLPRQTDPNHQPGPVASTRAAFETLYADYHAKTHAWVTRQVTDPDLAEELTQNTFLAVWDKVTTGAVDPASINKPCVWLRKWARMQILAHFNTPATRIEHTTAPDDLLFTRWRAATTTNPANQVSDRIDVDRLLAGVSDRARQVLTLHFLHDLTLTEVAATTGLTQTEVTALTQEGITRVRDALGITPEQVTARTTTDQDANLRRRLKTLASTPPGRQTQFRLTVTAAIAAGVYPAGTPMPSTRTLADRHAPTEPTLRNGDASIASRVLRALTNQGILTGSRTTGYTVTPDGPRLAATHVEPVPADQALARELLNGTWQPGDLLPSNSALARRWKAGPDKGVPRALATFADLGALTRTPTGRYQVTHLPGTTTAKASA